MLALIQQMLRPEQTNSTWIYLFSILYSCSQIAVPEDSLKQNNCFVRTLVARQPSESEILQTRFSEPVPIILNLG